MPRKGNVNNLKPCRTKDEAKERGRNGGLKSGVVRKFKADFCAALKERLEQGETMKELADCAVNNARDDIQWFLEIRDTIGQKPVDKAENKVQAQVVCGWED